MSEEDRRSIVERVFDDPDTINEGEYTSIYEFLLSPDIKDDLVAIAGVLEEFSGWAQYMLERMRKLSLTDQIEDVNRPSSVRKVA
jgi:hypothetical protein